MTHTSRVGWTALSPATLSPAALAFQPSHPSHAHVGCVSPQSGVAKPRHREPVLPVPSWLSPGGPGRWPAGAAQWGLAHVCLFRKARRHSRVLSDRASPGGMVPGGCEPGPTTALGQQHAGQELRAQGEEKLGQAPKLLCLFPSPLSHPRKSEVGLSCCRGNQDRLTRRTSQSLPEVFST